MDFFHNSLDQSISNSSVSGYFLLWLCFIEIPVFNANCVDLDQTPQSAASDLGPDCLQVTLLGVSWLKCVKISERPIELKMFQSYLTLNWSYSIS